MKWSDRTAQGFSPGLAVKWMRPESTPSPRGGVQFGDGNLRIGSQAAPEWNAQGSVVGANGVPFLACHRF
jgi:hypothetical protein